MIDSLLQQMPYTEILAIRKHFKIKTREIVRCESAYNKPEYLEYKKILDDIDEVLLDKYKNDNNNRYNHDIYPSN